MANLLRTTITIPEDLLKLAKLTSVKEGKTVEPETPMFKNPSKYVRRLREESDDR